MSHRVWQHLAMVLALLSACQLEGALAAGKGHFRTSALAREDQPAGTSQTPASASASQSSTGSSNSQPKAAVTTSAPLSPLITAP
eukprot:2096512-Amphidinium_carterae.1